MTKQVFIKSYPDETVEEWCSNCHIYTEQKLGILIKKQSVYFAGFCNKCEKVTYDKYGDGIVSFDDIEEGITKLLSFFNIDW